MPRIGTPSSWRFLGVVVVHGALAVGASSIGWIGMVAPPSDPAVPITVKFTPGAPPSAPTPPPPLRQAEPPASVVEIPPPPAVVPPTAEPPEPPRTTEAQDRRSPTARAGGERLKQPARPRPNDAARGARSTRIRADSPAGAGQEDRAPVLVKSSVPTYPVAARMANLEGSVQVRVAVDALGKVDGTSLSRSSGHPELDASALKAVRYWRFKPATRLGRPIAAETLVRVRFALR